MAFVGPVGPWALWALSASLGAGLLLRDAAASGKVPVAACVGDLAPVSVVASAK